MNEDRGHGALPKLYGAPAYARPPASPANPVERPVSLDDLPIEAERTVEEKRAAAELQARRYQPGTAHGGPAGRGHDGRHGLFGRIFRLRLPSRTPDGQ